MEPSLSFSEGASSERARLAERHAQGSERGVGDYEGGGVYGPDQGVARGVLALEAGAVVDFRPGWGWPGFSGGCDG